jgi:hypothetical protein
MGCDYLNLIVQGMVTVDLADFDVKLRKKFYCPFINPFQCGSLECAHCAASGPISPDKIGLFGPVPPVENTYPHSCGPIGEEHSLYGHVNC